MSTLNVENYSDGTDSVPASAVIHGTMKSSLHANLATQTIIHSYNNTSITDNGTGLFTESHTNNFLETEPETCGLVSGNGGNMFNDDSQTPYTTGDIDWRISNMSGTNNDDDRANSFRAGVLA